MDNKDNVIPSNRNAYLELLNEYHVRSGLSLRDVCQICDIDFTYIHNILAGKRKPNRDIIIAMGFAYCLERVDVDELLLLAGHPPIGRNLLREYRKSKLNGNF